MKKRLFFIATTLYSNAQAVRSSIKSVWYAIFAFVASSLMMLAPVSISKVATSGENIAKNFPVSSTILYDFIVELHNQGVTCKVEDSKFKCSNTQLVDNKFIFEEKYNENNYKYTVVFLDNDYKYDSVEMEKPMDDDNIIFFGEDKFYIRELKRNGDGEYKSSLTVTGDYHYCGGFDFNNIISIKNNGGENKAKIATYNMFCDFLYHVSISDFNVIIMVWLLLGIVSSLICILSGAFVINYGNRKGNLADEYGWKGSFKIACNLLLLPAIISVLIGFIMPESVIISLPIIYFIRVFFIYRAQFTRKGQKIAIKTHKGLEDYI